MTLSLIELDLTLSVPRSEPLTKNPVYVTGYWPFCTELWRIFIIR